MITPYDWEGFGAPWINKRLTFDRWGVSRSGLVELPTKEGVELCQHLWRVVTGHNKLHLRALACGQHHQAHDAFAIDLLFVLFDENVSFKLVCDAHDHGSRTCVNAHLVLHHQLLCEWMNGY